MSAARLRMLVLLTLCGLLLNVLLLYWKISDPASGISGCGAGAGCDEVLSSRWSQVLGLPLPAFGVAVYVLLYAALLWRKESLAAFCYTTIAGSALWLVFVQAVFLHHFCPWCMVAHGTGVLIAASGLTSGCVFRRGAREGVAAAFSLALVQLYGPVPVSHRIGEMKEVAISGADCVQAQGGGRKVAFDDGKKIYDIASLPKLGSPDARHVMVGYFDFLCPACHKMRGYLETLVAKHPGDVCVLLLPVPLDRSCNGSLPPDDAGHPGSCAITRIALAVWRSKPKVYPEIHARFMSDPPMDEATALTIAREKIETGKLDVAMSDPWIDRLIQEDIADWVSFSGKTRQLPKLLIRGKRILHGLPSGEADFIRVMERELGL